MRQNGITSMRMLKIFLTTVMTLALSMLTLSTASADDSVIPDKSPAGLSATAEVSDAEYRALFEDLERSDVPRSEEVVDGTRLLTFEIEEFALTLSEPDSPVVTPYLGGGIDDVGWYVTLNQTDQTALIAGGGAALGLAICAIPAVGQLACGASGVIIAVASVYLNEHGKCPNLLKLNYHGGSRYTPSCI